MTASAPTRRGAIAAGASLLLARPALAAEAEGPRLLAQVEREVGGRLGVFGAHYGTKRLLNRRPDERFPMCSTFKALLAGAVLARVDRGEERLDRRLPVRASDMVDHAPRTEPRIGREMTVAELCAAIVEVSDNPAANLLLRTIGGPEGFTRYVRGLGDTQTRLDRYEPEMNESAEGDPRDTTTPRAMAQTLRALTLGKALKPESRARLVGWMAASPTGARRIRAGAPAGWRAADKTGTGRNGSTNDIGVLWTPKGEPLVIVLYLTGSSAPLPAREAALARATRIVVAQLHGAGRG